MAELLIFNRAGTGKTGAYELDDIVVAMPDGHVWGREEKNPFKFRIVKLPNVTAKEVEGFLEEERDETDSERPMTRRRKWRLIEGSKELENKTTLQRVAWPQK